MKTILIMPLTCEWEGWKWMTYLWGGEGGDLLVG